MHANPKGVLVPDSGDDILGGIEKSLMSAGTVQHYGSIAEFRSACQAAKGNGVGPRENAPWYGDVHGVMYRCDGVPGSNGALVVRAVNEVEWRMSPLNNWDHNDSYTLNNGERRGVHTVSLPVREYPRLCFATCSLWGRVNEGEADCILSLGGSTEVYARFPDASDGNVSTSGAVIVEPGNSASFTVSIAGGGGNNGVGASKVETDSSHSSSIVVIAWPVGVS